MSDKEQPEIELDEFTNKSETENVSNVISIIETSLEDSNQNMIENENKGLKSKFFEILMRLKIIALNNLMLILITISGALGLGLGFAFRPINMDKQVKVYIGFPGELFARALKFITMPLIFCNLITGMSGLKTRAKNIKHIGLQTFLFYSVSLSSSLLLGYLFVLTIKPGSRSNKAVNITNYDKTQTTKISTSDTILDIFRNLVPDNAVAIAFHAYQSVLTPIYTNVTKISFINITNSSSNITMKISINETSNEITDFSVSGEKSYGPNFLGMLVFCLTFGSIISGMGEKGRDLNNFFDNLSKAFFQIINIVIWFSPIGVFSLLCGTILTQEQPEIVFQLLSLYVTSCLVGFIIQAVIILPLIYFILTRNSLIRLFKNVSEALLVAFATASSLVTLPVTLKCNGTSKTKFLILLFLRFALNKIKGIEQKHKVPKLISRPILFIGTSVHFSGSPLYQLIGAIFIAQIVNREIETAQYFLTAFLTLISASTVAGIPSGGLVTTILILNGLNLNQNLIGIIYPVDWFIDRFLTVVNVWGNCIATDTIYKLNKKSIENDEKDD